MQRDFIKKTRDWLLINQTEVLADLIKSYNHRCAAFLYHTYMQTVRAFIAHKPIQYIDAYNSDGLYVQLF